ncbi:heavy metal translocating P-type ATPase [Candidatus Aminicenantes bacterium AC-334-K16]|jgi:Cd2+/Zn2+-exporting ATPase|nr:heavy metal translocating P-type ATPase [Candidatus Aminicenantes bacterium AC-334-K16]
MGEKRQNQKKKQPALSGSTNQVALKEKKARSYRLKGLDCPDCALKIEKAVQQLKGVAEARVDFLQATLKLEVDDSEFNSASLEKTIKKLGYSLAPPSSITENSLRLYVKGLDCAEEVALIKKALSHLAGIKEVKFLLVSREIEVHFDPEKIKEKDIVSRINKIGLRVEPVKERGEVGREKARETFSQDRRLLLTTIIAGVLTLLGIILSRLGTREEISILIFLLAIISGGTHIARKGLAAARHLSLDMNFLMTIAVIGAASIGEWVEAAVVVFLFSLAQLLETYSLDRARRAIRSLMDLAPKKALVRRNGEEIEVNVETIQPGERVIVRPGEKIPLDGLVLSGRSEVNQAPITGESMPVLKQAGDKVFAGSINQRGSLEIKVTHLSSDTTLARIIHLVEEAQSQKAPSQSFVEKFARWYTPLVVLSAVLLAVIPVVVLGYPFSEWLYRALVLLVIACPCALVISTPVTIVAGLTRSANLGILIKGGVHLENSGKWQTIVFDKTGTLTKGKPEVIDIIPLGSRTKKEILQLAAAVESRSEHHLARAIIDKAEEWQLKIDEPADFQSLIGRGAQARVNGRIYFIGNHRLFEEKKLCTPELDELMDRLESENYSLVILGDEGKALGVIIIADALRPEVPLALRQLRSLGVKKLMMLTGDNRKTAEVLARRLELDNFAAELLPEDKIEAIRHLIYQGEKVAMVGDGVNDAPALAMATTGIAMGTAGTDAALETADIALMNDNLLGLPTVVHLGKKTLQIIKQNITLALVIKFIFFGLTIPGVATLWMAVFADMGASFIVIFNGLRLLRFKKGL